MVSPNSEIYEIEDDAIIVAVGNFARVLLFGEARSEFESLMVRTDQDSSAACVTLKRYFKRFADEGPVSLTDQMFKGEGRHSVNGENIQVSAFKAKQYRIYGVVDRYNDFRCFCGTVCDPKKKQRKADPAKLKKAAEEWLRIKR